jgi:hypothetical protein
MKILKEEENIGVYKNVKLTENVKHFIQKKVLFLNIQKFSDRKKIKCLEKAKNH